MFSSINIIIFFLWAASAIVDYSDYCAIWQLKEYRTDRFRDFLGTKKGKEYFRRYPFLWRSLLAIVVFLWPINTVLVIKYIIITIFTLDAIHSMYLALHRGLRRPTPTPKALTIIIISTGIEGGLFVLAHDWAVLLLLLILRFFIISGVVYLFSFPTWWLKRYYIQKAAKKLEQHSNLVVIGITGSYGKSSVKEFLAHFLSTTFSVVRTPRNTNTEIGVARFILSTSFSDKDMFIVEMGAYRPGEIELMCDMVKPRIGVLTAIAKQHLSLFGSIRNIQNTKYELLRSLPKNGYAVTNADNPYCTELLDTLAVKHIETFGAAPEHHPDCLITDIKKTKQGIVCSGKYQGKTEQMTAPVIGTHHAYNIAAAAMVAIHLDVDSKTITDAARTLPKNIHGSIKTYPYGQATIIDDSYNSNPEGFKAALDVLSNFSSEKKRIVITRGMLELGESSRELHEQIGGEIAFVADELVVISKDHFRPLQRGVGSKYRTTVLLEENPEAIVQYLREQKEKDVCILLENRMPAAITAELAPDTTT